MPRGSLNEKERVDEEFKSIGQLLVWQKYFFTFGGYWPLEKTYIRANIFTTYMAIHLLTQYTELFAVLNNLTSAVLSIIEASMQSLVLSKLIIFRHSSMLRQLLLAMKEDFADDVYHNDEEKKLYLKYHNLSKLYYKLSMPYIMCGSSLYYFRPILDKVVRGDMAYNNASILPFQSTIPYTMDDSKTYYMTYASMLPMVYFLAVQNAWICLLITIQLHICGQLSIVEHRIRNTLFENDDENSSLLFKSVVDRHNRSIWMARSSDDSFHFVLLLDLVAMTLMLGLIAYITIVGNELGKVVAPVYTFCGLATLALVYGYCIVGETLINQSSKIHTAYSECMWYESSKGFKRSVLICLLESQEPLRMTAGKFFVFSLPGFTNVLKTAMGYLSMLRKVTE